MPVTIYSTIRGLALAVVGPALILGFGAYGVATVGFHWLPSTALIAGLVLLGITLLDYPRHCVFDEEGIRRVSFLRTQSLAWDDVNAIERAQDTSRRWRIPFAGASTDEPKAPSKKAGLAARLGKRKYLLSNVVESLKEYDELSILLKSAAPHVYFGAEQPALDTVPTDLYRRKWRRAD